MITTQVKDYRASVQEGFSEPRLPAFREFILCEAAEGLQAKVASWDVVRGLSLLDAVSSWNGSRRDSAVSALKEGELDSASRLLRSSNAVSAQVASYRSFGVKD